MTPRIGLVATDIRLQKVVRIMANSSLPDVSITAQENQNENQKAPYISVKELRKVLGVDAKGLNDNFLRKVSVGLGQIALLLANNPEEFIKLTELNKEFKNE